MVVRPGISTGKVRFSSCITHLIPDFDTAAEPCQECIPTRGPKQSQAKHGINNETDEPSDLADEPLWMGKDAM